VPEALVNQLREAVRHHYDGDLWKSPKCLGKSTPQRKVQKRRVTLLRDHFVDLSDHPGHGATILWFVLALPQHPMRISAQPK